MKRYIVPALLIFAFLLCISHEGYAQNKATVPIDAIVVMDNSASMRTNDPEFLTGEMVSGVLSYLSEDSRIGFIVFAKSPELTMPLSSVADEGITERVKETLGKVTYVDSEIIATVTLKDGDTLWDLARKYYGDPFKWPLIVEMNDLPSSGRGLPVGTVIYIPAEGVKKPIAKARVEERTNIPAAVERAIYELKHNGRDDVKKLLLLITDGIVDMGDSAQKVEKYRWLNDELALESKNAGIQVFGVAFTDQSDFALIQTLAQKTNGNYYRVFKPEDIQGVISSINGAVSKTIQTRTEPTPSVAKEVVPTEKEARIPRELILVAVVGLIILGVVAVVLTSVKRVRKNVTDHGSKIPEACLVDMEDVTGKKTYMIDRKVITIGRVEGDNVDVCIDQNTVSATHAQVRYKDHNFYLIDLGSRNGTYLNDGQERITDEIRLKGGDVIAFDQYKFKFLVRGQGERGKTQISRVERGKAQEEQTRRGETPVDQTQPISESVSQTQRGGTQISQSGRGETMISSSGRGGTQIGQSGSNQTVINPNGHGSAGQNSSRSPSGIITMKKKRKVASNEDIAIPEAYLVDVAGSTDEKMYQLDTNLQTPGRAKTDDVDVCISRNTVSSAHAQIEYRDHNFYLTDLGSRNGTYLNEGRERITSEVLLKNDDIVYFDQYRFRFVVRD